MNDEHFIKNVDIKSEPKDFELFSSYDKNNTELIQEIKLENTSDADRYSKINIKHQAVEIKEEHTNSVCENSCNQSLNEDQSILKTIEFVNVKAEHNYDFETKESSLDNIIDPVAAKDG